ncbi:GvpL/GvpF family gas vesicle protein [Streptosporangium minutum]|uniref:Gas vesicle synthesis GvpLF n=1 Tax=Streptosporangium minutum TaxID=569862 RepID=A0A243RFH1_9ACTN|nr:GvpL/GvpF family gas vesicle protein [Streptosporangium minutum]OUC93481.1 gas vesicle synthesis GvpLF [Streptosporangium minutum]
MERRTAVADFGTYVYAVARDVGRPHPAGLTGVAGTPVWTIERAGLVAYVSTVPLDQFGEEPLRRSLEDLDWVGGTARAHHHVVEVVAEKAATAPIRLVTVYSSQEQVGELLERRHDDFVTLLSRVTGRKEWGVKAYVRQAAEPAGAEGGDALEADSPGIAYLKRRQASLRGREDAWRRAASQAERIHTSLAAVAVASRRHRPQDPSLSGRDEWMLLNGAYLVDDGRGDEFAAVLDTLRGEGIDVELTGPWAPYSFTALDLDLDAGDPESRDGG